MIDDMSHISRRRFLGGAAGVSAAVFLAACGGTSSTGTASSGGSSSSDATIKFWDMPWGNAEYNKLGAQIVHDYKPPKGLGDAAYQIIQWDNFTTTFAAAVSSGTGPAVSTGGGFQPFLFASEGKIAYADNLVAKFKKNGTYQDFVPGLLELCHTPGGYVSVPWVLDLRVWLYNKPVFDKLNLVPPTTWDEAVTTMRALKKAGHTGFAVNAGPNSDNGYQQLLTLMVNNGGGLFNTNNELDCVTSQNIEAMEWVTQLVKEGLISPSAVSYSDSDAITQWQKNNYVMGISDAGYNIDTGDPNVTVMPEPLTSPSGVKATLVYLNSIMMYKETPSQANSEAFLEYYLPNTGKYWDKKTLGGIPVLKSIAESPAFKAQSNLYTSYKTWVPVAKSFAARGDQLRAQLGDIDAGPQLLQFTQRIIGGEDAKSSLQTLQSQLESVATKS
jgi:multiple sugar transport system substrate-binding protein